jgi:ribonuclease PH
MDCQQSNLAHIITNVINIAEYMIHIDVKKEENMNGLLRVSVSMVMETKELTYM